MTYILLAIIVAMVIGGYRHAKTHNELDAVKADLARIREHLPHLPKL